MSPVVEVSGLTKSYGAIRAVTDVSFNVEPGETVALLGPNGSGKTTILRCVAGLLRPDTGTVRVCGSDLRRQVREAKRQFCYLPQLASFPANVTLREVMEFHAKLRNLDPTRVDASLQESGIRETEQGRLVEELSGGMLQRLSLAVAGMPAVNLMILDEPTANLDPEAAIRLREQAARWRREGRAILFSTHVLTDVEQLADKVVVMVGGKPVAEEKVAELQAALRRFALLRVNVGEPTEAHVKAALECGASAAELNSHSIVITAPAEKRYPILKRLGELGTIHHFDTEEPSIEQIYMKYVRDGER
jgi:ABC-type multidrug transport system ATPase subunit